VLGHYVPEQHYDGEATKSYCSRQGMARSDIPYQEDQLLDGGPVAYAHIFRHVRESKFRDELIHEYNKPNGSDETS
jgi:hypothetical protein